jgi:two-component system, chemotaxis family, protein-glutamate methylesterase/glutaminase
MENLSLDSDQKRSPEKTTSANNSAYSIVAMAASAGGLKAISQVLSGLPANFAASIVVVQHLDRYHQSLMANILSRRTLLTVKQAEQGDRLKSGNVYIAPPNHHLLANPDGTLALTQSKLVHFVRPCADLLFESVATSYQDKAIAVVLTGMGQDGIMGVQLIHKMGGKVIAQDRKTSMYFSMPHTAIKTGKVDLILPLSEIAPTLISLVM